VRAGTYASPHRDPTAAEPDDRARSGGSWTRRHDARADTTHPATDRPRPVLSCQTHEQCGELLADRRTARRTRLTPLPSHQPSMPPQQRRRRHNTARPHSLGQDPRKNSEHRPIRPIHPQTRIGATQHRDLVTKHKYLRVLRRRGPSEQRHPGQTLRQNLVQQSNNNSPTDHRTGNPAGQRYWRDSRPAQALLLIKRMIRALAADTDLYGDPLWSPTPLRSGVPGPAPTVHWPNVGEWAGYSIAPVTPAGPDTCGRT
jgi:hypothetical protein